MGLWASSIRAYPPACSQSWYFPQTLSSQMLGERLTSLAASNQGLVLQLPARLEKSRLFVPYILPVSSHLDKCDCDSDGDFHCHCRCRCYYYDDILLLLYCYCYCYCQCYCYYSSSCCLLRRLRLRRLLCLYPNHHQSHHHHHYHYCH